MRVVPRAGARAIGGLGFANVIGDATLKRLPITGGAPVTVGPNATPFGLSRDEQGILFGEFGKGILRIAHRAAWFLDSYQPRESGKDYGTRPAHFTALASSVLNA